MSTRSLRLVLLAALCQAQDNTQPVGTNPISVKSSSYLGVVTAGNSCSHRDLGFWGHVNNIWYATWGDTIYCKEPYTNPANDPAPINAATQGIVRDSFSQQTSNPLSVTDFNLNNNSPVGHPQQLIPYNTALGENYTWGFGGTSICETNAANNQGVVFYLRNYNSTALGAGVAQVTINPSANTTTVTRYGQKGYWWDSLTNPQYGDHIAFKDNNSTYIYAYGGPPANITTFPANSYVYGTRVLAASAGDLSQYEYFWGPDQGWLNKPLTTFTDHTAIFWGIGQGQILYSGYYNVYILVHLNFGGTQFMLRTSTTPYGPWTPDVVGFNVTSDGLPYGTKTPAGYAATAMPFFDVSGKTLTVSYTLEYNLNPVHRIVFN